MDDFVLGDRELDVMGVLWDLGSGTVSEVRERLPADLAYTTVLTILRNLEAKELVTHTTEGKAHRYVPRVARRAARRSALTRIVTVVRPHSSAPSKTSASPIQASGAPAGGGAAKA